jgi:hypothetical protein
LSFIGTIRFTDGVPRYHHVEVETLGTHHLVLECRCYWGSGDSGGLNFSESVQGDTLHLSVALHPAQSIGSNASGAVKSQEPQT